MTELSAWMLSFQFSCGVTSMSLTVADSEAKAAAQGLHAVLTGNLRLLSEDVTLTGVFAAPVPQEQLALLYRTAQGERPAAEVVQLVPRQEPTFEQKMRADLFVMCGLHGRQEGAHCQPCRDAWNRNEPHTFLAFDPQGGAA